MSGRTAVLLGATGLIGRHCLHALADSQHYALVVALVRRPLEWSHPKVRERLVDFDRLEGLTEPRVDDLYCALGTTIRSAGSQEAFRRVDHDYPLAIARWALVRGARQMLLVSSVDANASSGNFYLRVKGQVEEGLSALPWEGLHVLRPSILQGNRRESRPGERAGLAVAGLRKWALAGSWRRYRPIPAAAVAEAMVAIGEAGRTGSHHYEYDALREWAARRSSGPPGHG